MTAPSPPWLDRDAWPFAPRFLEVPDGRLHYVDEGTGKPVLFVHGVPTWGFLWRHAIHALHDRFRCVAPDHLGFGSSSKPVPGPSPRAHVANLVRLADTLDLQDATLVVHDWGGPLGLAWALEQRERVGRLVILNTWLWSSDDFLRSAITARLLASRVYDFLEDRFSVTARAFVPLAAGRRLAPEVRRHYREPLRLRAGRSGVRALARAIHTEGAWLDGLWAQRRRLRDLPALVIWGLRDPAFSRRDLARWITALPGADVRALAKVGHFAPEESPGEVVTLLSEFLAAAKPEGHSV